MNAQANEFIDAIALRVADIIIAKMNKPRNEEEDANLLCGWNAISEYAGMSVSKLVRMREQLGDAIWQQVANGKVYADKVQLKKKLFESCDCKN